MRHSKITYIRRPIFIKYAYLNWLKSLTFKLNDCFWIYWKHRLVWPTLLRWYSSQEFVKPIYSKFKFKLSVKPNKTALDIWKFRPTEIKRENSLLGCRNSEEHSRKMDQSQWSCAASLVFSLVDWWKWGYINEPLLIHLLMKNGRKIV